MRNTSSYRHVIDEWQVNIRTGESHFAGAGMQDHSSLMESYSRTSLQLIVCDKSITIKSTSFGFRMSNPFQGYMVDPKEIPSEEYAFEATFHAKGGISMAIGETQCHPDRRLRVSQSSQMYGVRLLTKDVGQLLKKNRDRLPLALQTLMDAHPGLEDGCLVLYLYACPYSQMVVKSGCTLPAIALQGNLYQNPLVRLAARRKEFNNFIRAWTGNGTKPVIRAAGSMTVTTQTTNVDESVGKLWVEQGQIDMISKAGKQTYPVLYNKSLFSILVKDLEVPLEKAATICAHISASDCHNLSVRWKYMVDSHHHSGQSLEKYDFPAIRQLFTLLSRESAIKLLSGMKFREFEAIQHYVPDTLRMLWEFDRPAKIKTKKGLDMFPEGLKLKRSWVSLKDLHDDISRKYTKLKALESRKFIKWPTKLRELHGRKVDDLRILLPRMTTKIVKWGKDQNHCVASFADRMVAQEEIIFGVFKLNKLTYVGRISVTSWKQKQNGEIVPLAITNQTPQEVAKLAAGEQFFKLSEIRSHSNNKVELEDLRKIYGILIQYGIENLYEGKF